MIRACNLAQVDWVRSHMLWYSIRTQQAKGMSDQEELIADCYHILFLNYFADSYIFDALEALKKDKQIYRHSIKQQVNEIQAWIRNYDKKVADTMGEDYNNKFSNMNFALQDAFQKMLDKLEEATIKALIDKGCKKAELYAKVEVCIMLNEFCVTNLAERVELNHNANPIMKRIEWCSHKDLHHRLMKMSDSLYMPDITKDIIVHDRFCKLQKFWQNPYFIADNLDDTLFDETEESVELRDIIKKSAV